jgi:hypothetical protein
MSCGNTIKIKLSRKLGLGRILARRLGKRVGIAVCYLLTGASDWL